MAACIGGLKSKASEVAFPFQESLLVDMKDMQAGVDKRELVYGPGAVDLILLPHLACASSWISMVLSFL